MHQTVTNALRTLVHTNPRQNMTQARDIINDALTTGMHAMQTTVATTLGSTPGALAFAQDMFLNMPLIADWQAIARTHEHHINENLRHANRKRRQFDYALGQLGATNAKRAGREQRGNLRGGCVSKLCVD